MQNKRFKIQMSKGYTLMELVVAIGIFIIVATAITGVFIAIARVQRKTTAMQAVQQDARWAMETMARYARIEKIRYCKESNDEYCHSPLPISELKQAGFDGGEILYLENTYFKKEFGKLQISKDGGTTWTDITPDKVEVLDLKFYLAPASISNPDSSPDYLSPYDSEGPDQQSQVTILMKTRSLGGREAEKAEITLQTSVSTRAYVR